MAKDPYEKQMLQIGPFHAEVCLNTSMIMRRGKNVGFHLKRQFCTKHQALCLRAILLFYSCVWFTRVSQRKNNHLFKKQQQGFTAIGSSHLPASSSHTAGHDCIIQLQHTVGLCIWDRCNIVSWRQYWVLAAKYPQDCKQPIGLVPTPMEVASTLHPFWGVVQLEPSGSAARASMVFQWCKLAFMFRPRAHIVVWETPSFLLCLNNWAHLVGGLIAARKHFRGVSFLTITEENCLVLAFKNKPHT